MRENKLTIVVVGIDHWEDLTEPFYKGLRQFNPFADILIVDNLSKIPYPSNEKNDVIRTKKQIGYGQALNGAAHIMIDWDWLLCCNNDCVCDGKIDVSQLDPHTLYGNDWKYQYEGRNEMPAVLDSAYFLIPRWIWNDVGQFDEGMDAAFEEVDYCLRALRKGYKLDVVKLPIYHLNLHTRRELAGYTERWNKTVAYFREKYHDTGFQITA
jgi:GT2 family glycosyltransferase